VFIALILLNIFVTLSLASTSTLEEDDASVARVEFVEKVGTTSTFNLKSCGPLNVSGATYKLIKDVSSRDTCFTILADGITLDGAGHKVYYAKKSNGYGVNNVGGYSNLTLKRLIISTVSSSPNSLKFDHNIYSYGGNNVVISGNTLINHINSSSGIIVQGINGGTTASNAQILNNVVKTGDYNSPGIYIDNSINFSISENSVHTKGSISPGLQIATYMGSSSNHQINNNRIRTLGSFSKGISAEVNNFPLEFLSISQNDITTSGLLAYGLILINSNHNEILDNSIDTLNARAGSSVYLQNTRNVSFEGNSITSKGSYSKGLVVIQSQPENNDITALGNKFDSNSITSTKDVALIIDGSSYNSFSNNKISSSLNDAINLISKEQTPGINLVPNNTLFLGNVLKSGKSFNDLVFFSNNLPSAYISDITFLDQVISKYVFDSGSSSAPWHTYLNSPTFENSKYGKLTFYSPIGGFGKNLSAEIQIKRNLVLINATVYSGLSRPANITLYDMSGLNFGSDARIYRDGQICASCYNFTPLTADNVIFNVSGAGLYSLQ